MRFSIPLATAVLASTAYAQIDVVQKVLNDVKSGIGSLDGAVQGFSGDSAPLIDASQALVGTLTDGKSTVDGSKDLSLADALGLQQPVKDLTSAAQTLVDNLKTQKPALAEKGFCADTLDQITQINKASNSLIDAVVAKVPPEAQGIAQGLVADLKSVLQEAQDQFSEANCKNSGGGGGTSSEPAPTSTGGGDGSSIPPTQTPTQTSGGGGDSTVPPTSTPTQTGGGGSTVPAPTSSGRPTATTSTPGNGTSPHTTGPPVVTGGAGAVVPAGALALGFAVLLV